MDPKVCRTVNAANFSIGCNSLPAPLKFVNSIPRATRMGQSEIISAYRQRA
jgi:hypothetical protein